MVTSECEKDGPGDDPRDRIRTRALIVESLAQNKSELLCPPFALVFGVDVGRYGSNILDKIANAS
jgi:hypothetical protein